MKMDGHEFSRPPFRSARLVAARHGLVARATHGQAESDFGVRDECSYSLIKAGQDEFLAVDTRTLSFRRADAVQQPHQRSLAFISVY